MLPSDCVSDSILDSGLPMCRDLSDRELDIDVLWVGDASIIHLGRHNNDELFHHTLLL